MNQIFVNGQEISDPWPAAVMIWLKPPNSPAFPQKSYEMIGVANKRLQATRRSSTTEPFH
jgi:hypothetical protein